MRSRTIVCVIGFMWVWDVPLAGAAPSEEVRAGAPAVVSRRPAAEYYHYATDHLKRGRWFERAAKQLAEAVRQEPNNYRYHNALGCAWASRAASLGYAASFAQALAAQRGSYAQRLAAWKEAQNDPDSDLFDTLRPAPIPPFALRTKDDGRLFTLTQTQSDARIKELEKQARASWDRALVCAKTPDEQAEVYYHRGWGLWLPQRCRGDVLRFLTATAGESEPLVPEAVPKETQEALAKATDLAPDVAAYCQSLGDVLAHDRPKARTAYRRSLALDRRNATLWYRLYRWNVDKPLSFPDENGNEATPAPIAPPDKTRPLEDLEEAVRADPLNAFPLYQLAIAQFEGSSYGLILAVPKAEQAQKIATVSAATAHADRRVARDALLSIERGNRAPRYIPLRHRPAIPALLAGAWNYPSWMDTFMDFQNDAQIRQLARTVCGYALATAKTNDLREAERATRAVINLGHKMLGDWPVKDVPRENKEVIRGLVAVMIASIGYATLPQIYQQASHAAQAARAQAEYDAFKQRVQTYRKAVAENISALDEYGELGTALEYY